MKGKVLHNVRHVVANGKLSIVTDREAFSIANDEEVTVLQKDIISLSSDLPKYRKIKYQPSLANQNPIDLSASWDGYHQPLHPKVLYIPEGFAGYEYWLVMSPLPVGGTPYADRWEDPVVFKSHTGINDWEVIDSANPLDDITDEQITRGDYLSDPHLVYRKDLKRLEVWYRHTINTTDDINGRLPTAIYRKTTTDGTTWSEREKLIDYKSHNADDIFISHAVWYDYDQNLYIAYHVTNTHTKISTSPDATTWTLVRKCFTDKDMYIWHMDMEKINGQYVYVACNNINKALEIYTSDNGYAFKFRRVLLSEKWVQNIYRSCICKDENGMFRVYISLKVNNAWKIVLFAGDSIDSLQWVSGTDIVETAYCGGALIDTSKEQAEIKASQVTMNSQSLPSCLDDMWSRIRMLESSVANSGKVVYAATELKDGTYALTNRYIKLDMAYESGVPYLKHAGTDNHKVILNCPVKQRTWYKIELSGTHSMPLVLCGSKNQISDIVNQWVGSRIDKVITNQPNTVNSFAWFNDEFNYIHLDCDSLNRTSIKITELNIDATA